MIIGLVGLKNSGKDEAGAYLMKEHGFERRAFADPGKKYMASVLDIPFSLIEQIKNDPEVRVEVYDADDASGPDSNEISLSGMTFRQFMQNFIQNAKQIFGDKVWVDTVLPVDGFYVGRPIVITDCRFTIEADRIRQLDGYIVRIDRYYATDDGHVSETQQSMIEPDFVVNNHGSIRELYVELDLMLNQMLERVG